MFFGLPCVATDIWAMSEMIQDGVTGYLVPPESPEKLAAGMKRILVDPALQQSMGDAARKRAEQMFSWEAVGYALQTGIQRIRKGARN
jgi:rhamnosyl/mannosyltransferase